ncbi:MAG: hypothetical protein IBJ15_10740, partial [Alphaproteobacteria bacterium]|nr:hypothetical protein [Alphaproteobacteria bacterium]
APPGAGAVRGSPPAGAPARGARGRAHTRRNRAAPGGVAGRPKGPAVFADEIPHRELELRFLPKDLGPSSWRGEFRDGAMKPGWNAYWFRVRQWDGGIAWSSPIFVEMTGTPR